MSGLGRITGSILSGGFYVFGFGYLVAPLIGWHWESAAIAASVATWPILAKVGLKTVAALPFAFHTLNGLRHLSWDVLVGLNNKAVTRSGLTVIALTAVSTLYLVFGY
jgi:succinate dehydrogenase (ubiquinone) cytochrome b560 subunit